MGQLCYPHLPCQQQSLQPTSTTHRFLSWYVLEFVLASVSSNRKAFLCRLLCLSARVALQLRDRESSASTESLLSWNRVKASQIGPAGDVVPARGGYDAVPEPGERHLFVINLNKVSGVVHSLCKLVAPRTCLFECKMLCFSVHAVSLDPCRGYLAAECTRWRCINDLRVRFNVWRKV